MNPLYHQQRELVELVLSTRCSARIRAVLREFPTYAEMRTWPTCWSARFLRDQYRRAAHSVYRAALRDGRLVRPDRCSECGATGRIEGHHDDYDAPLEVRWLCRDCHRAADVARRRRDRNAA